MDSFAPGTHLERFRIVQELGRGGMGIVYRAYDEKLHRDVALKVLPAQFASRGEHRARFLREARAGAALSHPNIVTIHEIGEVNGRIFVAMELVEGESLRCRLDRGPLAVREAVAIALPIASALARAHERHLVHRDLKPDNVMIGNDGSVKVLDFGIAKDLRVDELGPTVGPGELSLTGGAIIGTPAYMSPEQATGRPVSPASDVFSFGVLLFETLKGRRPFEANAFGALVVAITRDPPAPLELEQRASPELESLVMRCLEKEPSARFGTGAELCAALRALPESGAGHELRSASLALARTARQNATPTGRQRAGRVRLLVAALGLMLAVTLGFGLGGRKLFGSHTALSAASGPPAPSATAVADLSGRPGASPEVLAIWREALRLHADGRMGESQRMYRKVLDADPKFTPARVQIAAFAFNYSDYNTTLREQAKSARAEADQLSDRDRIVLEAAEALLLRVPAEPRTALATLTRASESFPLDAQVWMFRGSVEALLSGQKLAAKSIRRALELDRSYTFARFALAQFLAYQGDTRGARDELEICLKLTPSSHACLREIELIDANDGRCDGLEIDARRHLLADPSAFPAQRFLANALTARGELLAAAEVLFSPSGDAGTDPEKTAREPLLRSNLALLAGDFAGALAHARRGAELVRDDRRELHQGLYAVQIALLLDESGDRAGASREAANYLARRASLEPIARNDDYSIANERFPWLLPLAQRSGAVSAARGQEQLEGWNRAWKQALPDDLQSYLWPNGAAIGALVLGTEEAGQRALAAWDPSTGLPTYLPTSAGQATIGVALLLGGRSSEALPWLERATRNCNALDLALVQTRAFHHFGVALEQRQEKAKACEAFARVLDRWERAKPRSITAEVSRARFSALECDRRPAESTGAGGQ